ncbi:MAG: glucosamine-6-phosphate deaminase [Acidobacteriota bacterium]|jgi:glucosamine-6-phosphate deaminase|nr:glucosamine-6-phosphate deaminase [Acidobacteriota bacterium]
MKWETFNSQDALADRAAHLLLRAIRENPRIVLGLPTGRTPIGMYDRVVRECSREYHCFRDVTTFNLDEYAGVSRDDPGSYFSYMNQHLFAHVDIDPANAHLPHGEAPDLDAECVRYEHEIRDAGGLELTFLGLGRNGHIGFNEPGTPFDARTRVVELTQSTRHANADLFPEGHVPTHAITMGIGTILESRAIVLLVAGGGKEEAAERLRSGEVSVEFPASALHEHADVTVLSAV